MGERFLTIKEVAQMMGVCRMTLLRWQGRGLFPKTYVLAPHKVGFKGSEIEEWIASREQSVRIYREPDPSKRPPRKTAEKQKAA